MTDQEKQGKKPLDPSIIRREMRESARRSLVAAIVMSAVLVAVGAVMAVEKFYDAPADADTMSRIGPALLMAVCFVMAVAGLVRAVKRYRCADEGELLIELDTVSYVESDRATMHRRGLRVRGPVYKDFLHFESGRVLEVERYQYREMRGEVFITVAYPDKPAEILRIYRFSEYEWRD